MKRASIFTVGAVLAAIALAAPAAAQDQGTQDNISYGGTSGEFLLLGAGARGLALGGAYAALTTDVSALYYNPAGLAQIERAQALLAGPLAKLLDLGRRSSALSSQVQKSVAEVVQQVAEQDRRLATMDTPPLWQAVREGGAQEPVATGLRRSLGS